MQKPLLSLRAALLLSILAWMLPVQGLAALTDLLPGTQKDHYHTLITGIEDDDLIDLLTSVSTTATIEETKPPSIRMLEHRAKSDVPELIRVLKSEGFFKARIDVSIDRLSEPPVVEFKVQTGPRFAIGVTEVVLSGQTDTRDWIDHVLVEQEMQQGAPYRSAKVLGLRKAVLERLTSTGHPVPSVLEQQVVADHLTESVDISLTVDPGPSVVFGETTITGLVSVKERYARRLLTWNEGERFDASKLTRGQTELIRSGLFSYVNVSRESVAGEKVPVTITVKERPHRTVRAGAGYATDEGPGVTGEWEHRNLFSGGEKLLTRGKLSDLLRSLDATYTEPVFLNPNQQLKLHGAIADEDTDAYTSQSITTSAIVERRITDMLTLGAGLRYRFSNVDRLDSTETFGLVSLPLQLRYDTSDELFDPSEGGRLNLETAPYFDVLGSDVTFLRLWGSYTRYIELLDDKRLILALRAGGGYLHGAGKNNIPADVLFYAGGGGSVRGYAYQTAGDLEDDDPTGGLSLAEFSGEFRFRLTERLGLVTFVDAGRAFGDRIPFSDQDLFWGTGLGVRYYTPIGPVRLDVAVPLDRRDVDRPFQFYISIGQSF